LIDYLKNTYTTRKSKNIVDIQVQKYKQMMDDLYEQKEKQWISTQKQHQSSIEYPINEVLSEQELRSVNHDLDDFIQQLL
jgi:dTDP-4-amino-4,6-dideoxygalactose transaminase